MLQVETKGTLYVVATPIGNLADITFRAIEILKLVDNILCEDTKISIKLLNHYNITKPLISYNTINEETKINLVINLLNSGKNIAIISDAGTPLISDPGYKLIKYCREENIKVVGIPGPSSITLLASISGIPCNNFTFLGFLDKSKNKQYNTFKRYNNLQSTLIILESPKRLISTLTNIADIFGKDQIIAVGKELTKLYENVFYNTVSSIIQQLNSTVIKGEYTIMFLPNSRQNITTTKEVTSYLIENINIFSAKALANNAANLFKLNKKDVYQQIINLKNKL